MDEVRKALIIASDTFDDYPALQAPVKEAIELAGLLADPAVGDFAIQTLFNKSQREIGVAINSFFQSASLGDLLLLYFAGHGALDEDRRFYFVARDSSREHLPFTGVNEDHVRKSMQQSRSKRKVLMVDCCFSGALVENILARSDGMMDLKGKLASAGTVLLTASDAMEYSYETKDAFGETKSIYTSRIIEGLRSGEADRDQDGLISTDDLYEYALDRINLEDSRQKPQQLAKADGLIILAKTTGGEVLALKKQQDQAVKDAEDRRWREEAKQAIKEGQDRRRFQEEKQAVQELLDRHRRNKAARAFKEEQGRLRRYEESAQLLGKKLKRSWQEELSQALREELDRRISAEAAEAANEEEQDRRRRE